MKKAKLFADSLNDSKAVPIEIDIMDKGALARIVKDFDDLKQNPKSISLKES